MIFKFLFVGVCFAILGGLFSYFTGEEEKKSEDTIKVVFYSFIAGVLSAFLFQD